MEPALTFMPWDPRYETGIPEIDRQHRRLVAIINHVSKAMAEQDSSQYERIFNELVEYAQEHFAYEEALLARTGFPDRDRHHLEHKAFKAHLADLYEQEIAPALNPSAHLAAYLKDWLQSHILVSDQAYAEHARRNPPSTD